MSFVTKIFHAIGLYNLHDDEDDDFASALPRALKAPQAQLARTGASPDAVDSILETDPMLPGCIFDAVIRLFNRTMPEFVTRCLDTDSQRQYLYHAIESDVRRQIERVVEQARHYGAAHPATDVDPQAIANDAERSLRHLVAERARQKAAYEARIAELEEMVAQAADRESELREEVANLNRRLRRSRLKPDMADGQPSLF